MFAGGSTLDVRKIVIRANFIVQIAETPIKYRVYVFSLLLVDGRYVITVQRLVNTIVMIIWNSVRIFSEKKKNREKRNTNVLTCRVCARAVWLQNVSQQLLGAYHRGGVSVKKISNIPNFTSRNKKNIRS